jgi:predicted Na+-dependent transporter
MSHVSLNTVANVLIILFVLSNMAALGLTLTIKEIAAPLSDRSLVLKALAANFIVVPMAAFLLTQILHLERGLCIGLILLSTAAGDAFVLKLSQIARANMAFTLGLLVFVNVTSVIYMPIVVPLLLPGVSVDPWSIAKTLVTLMLLPLAIGLLVRARFPGTALMLASPLDRLSSILVMVAMAMFAYLMYDDIIATWGSRAILSTVILVSASFAAGYFMVRSPPEIRSALGLVTGQRNGTAALVIAVRNFPGEHSILVMIAIFILLGTLAVLVPLAAGLCRPRNVQPEPRPI